MREKKQHYDIIGDVHGRWDKLEPLLAKLGYEHDGICHIHPEDRKAIFLGDLIDPKGDVPNGVREVLITVKAMCDAGHAQCILGNHELHFAAYHTRNPRYDENDPNKREKYLKPHNKSSKSNKMHIGTHAALDEEEIKAIWLPWIKQLPFFIELPGLRVVHACWLDESINVLRGRSLEDPEFLRACVSKAEADKEIYEAAEIACKGVEIPMPEGHSFKDPHGIERFKFRARWWEKESEDIRARSLVFPASKAITEEECDPAEVAKLPGYGEREVPVFIGHYYKPSDSPLEPEASNVCCIDYSAANGGPLVAYRWNGNHGHLEPSQMVMHCDMEEYIRNAVLAFLKEMPDLIYDGDNAWESLVNSGGELYFMDGAESLYCSWAQSALEKLFSESLFQYYINETSEGSSYQDDYCEEYGLDYEEELTLKNCCKDEMLRDLAHYFMGDLRAYAEDLQSEIELAEYEAGDEDEDEDYDDDTSFEDAETVENAQQHEETTNQDLNTDLFINFLTASKKCAMEMMENAAYMIKALPTFECDHDHRKRIQAVCNELISTKHDVLNDIADIDLKSINGMDKCTGLKRADRIASWLQDGITSMHETVTLLTQDPNAGLAFMLVSESGVNILNAYNVTADAYDLLNAS